MCGNLQFIVFKVIEPLKMIKFNTLLGNAGREVECREGRGCQRDYGVVKG